MPTLLAEENVSISRGDLSHRSPREIVSLTRSPGLHLSGVLRYIASASKMSNWSDQLDEDELPLRMMLGLAFEEFAATLYPHMLWQPGEVHKPVHMNCDGMSQLEYRSIGPFDCLEEFKLTWCKRLTGGELIARRWFWIQQAAGYCIGYGVRHVRFHVCWVNGDWKPPQGPIYSRYLLEYSEHELRSTLTMIERNRAGAIAAGYEEK